MCMLKDFENLQLLNEFDDVYVVVSNIASQWNIN